MVGRMAYLGRFEEQTVLFLCVLRPSWLERGKLLLDFAQPLAGLFQRDRVGIFDSESVEELGLPRKLRVERVYRRGHGVDASTLELCSGTARSIGYSISEELQMGEHALFGKLFQSDSYQLNTSNLNLNLSHPLLTAPRRNRAPPNTVRISFMDRQTCDAKVIRDIGNDQHYKACIRHNRDCQHHEYKLLDVLGRVLNQRWPKSCVESVTQSRGPFLKIFTGQTRLACWHQWLQRYSRYTSGPTPGEVGWLRARLSSVQPRAQIADPRRRERGQRQAS